MAGTASVDPGEARSAQPSVPRPSLPAPEARTRGRGRRRMTGFQSVLHQAPLEWFQSPGHDCLAAPVLAPDGDAPERADWKTPLREGRFRAALSRINPHLPAEALEDVARK